MQSIARLRAALLFAMAVGCGGNDGEPPLVAGGGDASLGDGAVSSDSGSTGNPAGANDAGVDARPGSGSDAEPPLELEVPASIVECDGTPCDTLHNVCCGSWSRSSGFNPSLSCVPIGECNKKFQRVGNDNRSVSHECDGKEDCFPGHVCCFYAYGAPLCELGDLLECTTKMYGPGGSRICSENDACKLGETGYIGDGAPIGTLSCNVDNDCSDRPGTSCQPELNNSDTTGKGVRARSYIKVCR